jgi:hypothetical protein
MKEHLEKEEKAFREVLKARGKKGKSSSSGGAYLGKN